MATEVVVDNLNNTAVEINHQLGQVSAIIFMIRRNRDQAYITHWAAVNKETFLKGLRGIALKQVPIVGMYTYEYVQTMIEVAESMNWTNIDDLQKLLAMKQAEKLGQSEGGIISS